MKILKKKTEKLTNRKGITLIALVITIIVLLILAGVTISALSGDNGILTRTQQGKTKTEEAELEEKIKLAISEAQIGENGYQGLTADNLESELIKDGTKAIVFDNEDGTKHILFLDEKKEYKLDSNGNIEDLNIDFDTKYVAPSSQDEERNSGVIGIGTDGKTVDMDLWEYTLLEDNTYALNDSEAVNGNIKTSGYNNENIVDGKVQGTIPQYIIEGENNQEFKAVTSLRDTFRGLTSLKEPPVIPTTINSMYETFSQCSELIAMPEIPNMVMDMTSTFYNCTNLQNLTNIPDGVKIMSYTFYNCDQIILPPKLPNSVENIRDCFRSCSKLTQMPDIPENVIVMARTFMECVEITEMKRLPNKVTNLADCFRGCIKLTTATTIPNSVTNMRSTFRECSNLQGIIEINANLTGKITEDGYEDYLYCLKDATTNEGTTLQVTGSCTILDKIIENANNPKITL